MQEDNDVNEGKYRVYKECMPFLIVMQNVHHVVDMVDVNSLCDGNYNLGNCCFKHVDWKIKYAMKDENKFKKCSLQISDGPFEKKLITVLHHVHI